MIYSRVYKRFFPFQEKTDVLMLNEEERSQLAKCICSLPKLLKAWSIELLHKYKPSKSSDFSWLGTDLAVLAKECAKLSEKVMTGCVLTDDEINTINLALRANKYNWFFSCFFISSRSHIERLYFCSKREDVMDKNVSTPLETSDLVD